MSKKHKKMRIDAMRECAIDIEQEAAANKQSAQKKPDAVQALFEFLENIMGSNSPW